MERRAHSFCAVLLISFLLNQTRNPLTGARAPVFCSSGVEMTKVEKIINDPSLVVVEDAFLFSENEGVETFVFRVRKREVVASYEREDPLGR